MLFLVRHVNSREQADLEAIGFTFRPPNVCIEGLTRNFRVTPMELMPLLDDLYNFDTSTAMLEPGVYLAALAVKPSLGSSKWTILVQKRARNLLPLIKLGQPKLEKWQADLLIACRGTGSDTLFRKLRQGRQRIDPPPGPEEIFMGKMFDAMTGLRARIGVEAFSSLQLAEKILPGPVSVPPGARYQTTAALVICLYGILDVHHVHPPDAEDEFVSSKMVLAHQKVYPKSTDHVEFANSVRDEFDSIEETCSAQEPSIVSSVIKPKLSRFLKSLGTRTGSGTPTRTMSLATLTPLPYLPAMNGHRQPSRSGPATQRSSQRTQKLDIHISSQINVDVKSVESSQSEDPEQGDASPGEYGVHNHIEANAGSPSMVETFLKLLERRRQLASEMARHRP